jgi:hypothetical protein
MSEMKTSLITCSAIEGSYGGGVTYARELDKALNLVGVENRLTTFDDIGSPDVLILGSIGMNGENGKSAESRNKKRFAALDEYYGKIPFVLVAHDTTELRTFRKSREYFSDKKFSAIVSVGDSPAAHESIQSNFKADIVRCIRHPFSFDHPELFKDKTPYKNKVCSTSRIAGAKRTHLVLQLANECEKDFEIWSAEKGVYWYHTIKSSHIYDPSFFYGAWEEHGRPYHENAFCIDLTLFAYKGMYDGERTQYSILDAIESGCIPIGFDCWRWDDGYEGVWLPSPKKNGNKFIWEFELYKEIIDSAEYDFEMAQRNLLKIMDMCNIVKIGEEFKQLLLSINKPKRVRV